MGLDTERNRFVKLAFCRADLLFELDGAGALVFVAGPVAALLGKTGEALTGTPFLALVAEAVRAEVAGRMATGAANGRIEDMPVVLAGAAGRAVPVVMAGYRAADFDDHVFLAAKVDLAALAAAKAAPALLEQGSFTQRAAERIAAEEGKGLRSQITLLRIENLDGLLRKVGASAKGRFMAAVSEILSSQALGGDSAGQIDGENFSFVHAETVDTDEVGAAISQAARELGPDSEAVTVRMATLEADGAGMTEQQVAKAVIHTIKRFVADGTLGRRKSLGQVLGGLMADTVKTVATIRRIASKTDLDLVYMPICDLRLGRVHHFEMLTRFHEPGQTASPFALITLAEDVEIIQDLDFAIVKKSIDMLAALDPRQPIPPVAVNLSGQSLMKPAFVERLHGLLRATGVAPQKVMFEITESARVDDLATVNTHMQSLRKRGFKFSLDDFGAGSASFDYLNSLDADFVKFDGPVVRRACASNKGSDMLSTMAKMCSNQKIWTVAEMVEDKAMANQVYYCGIDYGQGWYFGKPTDNPYAFADRFAGGGE